MIPLAGYADRLSVRPGETIRFHVSNGTGTAVASPSIVRVISATVAEGDIDHILIDLAGTREATALKAIARSDLVIIPAQASEPDLHEGLQQVGCTGRRILEPTRLAPKAAAVTIEHPAALTSLEPGEL